MLKELHQYTGYTARVAAVNSNGPGPSSAERRARTWSDVPSETPQNITVETASDTVGGRERDGGGGGESHTAGGRTGWRGIVETISDTATGVTDGREGCCGQFTAAVGM